MSSSNTSLWNVSKEIKQDTSVQEAADAEKEYEQLLASRSTLRMRRSVLVGEHIDDNNDNEDDTNKKPQPHKRETQIFRTICEYKKPATLLRAPDFKLRFVVIDSQYKFMRIYRTEQELKNREPFKYELPLKSTKISLKTVDKKDKCITLTIKKQEHAFHFKTNELQQTALRHIRMCTGKIKSTATATETVSRMVSDFESQQSLRTASNSMQNSGVTQDMLLEIYAETDKGRQVARWLNENKDTLRVQQLNKLSQILSSKQSDHTFIQDFSAGQGLTYLCSLSILRFCEWEMLIVILNIFEVIVSTRIGYNLLREHSHAIQAIADLFEHQNKVIKCKVINLLTKVCIQYDDDYGHEAVLCALYSYGERHHANSVFDEFVRSMYFEQDLHFRRDALKFVNVVLNLSPDVGSRIESRHFLTELGFDNVLDQLWELIVAQIDDDSDGKSDEPVSAAPTHVNREKLHAQKLRYDESVKIKNPLLEEIKQQLITYRKLKQEDDEKMFWSNVNLNDPQDIVRYLFKKAMQQKHISQFLHTLIAMCTIPENASVLWTALPPLILHATGQKIKVIDDNIIQNIQSGSSDESDEEGIKIFDNIQLLKERLNKAMTAEVKQEENEYQQQIQELNEKTEKLAHENMRLASEKIKFQAKQSEQNEQIQELKQELETLATELKEAQIKIESRPQRNVKQIFTPKAAPLPQRAPIPAPLPVTAPIPAPLPMTAPLPMAAPLPNTAPMPAPIPALLPMAAPIPLAAAAPMTAPIPKAAPLPNTAPMAAPIPAPLPMAAPIPNTAPMAAPIPMSAPIPIPAPLPGSAPMPMSMPAPLPTAAPLPGAAPIAAPLPAAPIPNAPAPPPLGAPVPPTLCAPPPLGLPLPPLPFAPPVLAPPPLGRLKKTSKNNPVPTPRKKMVPFHWKPIKKVKTNTNKKSIWNDISLDNIQIDIQSNTPTTDKERDDNKTADTDTAPDSKQHIHLNIDELEKLFGKPVKRKKKSKPKSSKSKPKKQKREIISLLDDKRSYNMCIALSRLKMQNAIVCDSILSLNEEYLDLDKIQKLMPIVPTAEEQEMFKNFDGEARDLDVADKFCYALRNIENLGDRLKFWEFKLQFDELCTDEQQRVAIYKQVHHTLFHSTSFQKMLQFVLLVGNYMNSGTKKGGVAGFRVESLLALGNNKSADKTESLLSFIVKQCKKDIPVAVEFRSEFIKILPAAIKLDAEFIQAAIAEIGKTLQALRGKIKEDAEDKQMADSFVIVGKTESDDQKDDAMEDMFEPIMRRFWTTASSQYKELSLAFERSQTALFELGVYFGQKNDTEFEYIAYLFEFAQQVNKVVAEIQRQEAVAVRERKKAEADLRRKAAKKLREQKRKESKQLASKKRKGSRRKQMESLADGAVAGNAAVTLEHKLQGLFSGAVGLNIDDFTVKTKRRVKGKKSVQQKMDGKMSALGAQNMLDLMSIDNIGVAIQQRRKSRDTVGGHGGAVLEKKQGKQAKLRGIEEADTDRKEPGFRRQTTAFKITATDGKGKKLRAKEKRKQRRRKSLRKLGGLLGFN